MVRERRKKCDIDDHDDGEKHNIIVFKMSGSGYESVFYC